MEKISAYLETINSQIEKLINLHRSLSEQNKILQTEKQELLNQIKSKEEQIKQINENYKLLKIAKTISLEQNTDAKLKINEIVREIDKSIALLNK